VRGIRRVWGLLGPDWEAGLRRLPFFTQRTAVLLLGVLVATLALLGGVVALVGWPGANGPNRLVPGEQAGLAPVSRPGPGAAAASPAPADTARPAPARPGGAVPGTRGSGGAAGRTQGSGGAAGAGAGGPSAAPPTTLPPTTTRPGPLDPVDDLLGPVVSTLLP
jgi:hypothetical protein